MSMDAKELIARRIALELKDGSLVNLGIGMPNLVAKYLPRGVLVFFQVENGMIGMDHLPDPGLADEYLADAGGSFIGAIPGACAFDSAFSFGLIRGGHVDVTVLGGLEVDERGVLANWTIPGKMVPGMGGAMDLVTGAKRVIVAMIHTAKGKSKILKKCTLPLTSVRPGQPGGHRSRGDRADGGRPCSEGTGAGRHGRAGRSGDRGETDRSVGSAGNATRRAESEFIGRDP